MGTVDLIGIQASVVPFNTWWRIPSLAMSYHSLDGVRPGGNRVNPFLSTMVQERTGHDIVMQTSPNVVGDGISNQEQ